MSSMTFIIKITVILFSIISVSSKTWTYQIDKGNDGNEMMKLQAGNDDSPLWREYESRRFLFWDADYFGFSHYIPVMKPDGNGTISDAAKKYIFGEESELKYIRSCWTDSLQKLPTDEVLLEPREVKKSEYYPKIVVYNIGQDNDGKEMLRRQGEIGDIPLSKEYEFQFRTDLFWDADYFGFSHYIPVMTVDREGTISYSIKGYIFGDGSDLQEIWSIYYQNQGKHLPRGLKDENDTLQRGPRAVTKNEYYPNVCGIGKQDDGSKKMYHKGGKGQSMNTLLKEYDSPTVFFWEAAKLEFYYIAVTKPDQPEGSGSTYILGGESELVQFWNRWNKRMLLPNNEALSKPQKVKQNKYYPMRYTITDKRGNLLKRIPRTGGRNNETLADEYESLRQLIWEAKKSSFSHYIVIEKGTFWSTAVTENQHWTLPTKEFIFCEEPELLQIWNSWRGKHHAKEQVQFKLIETEHSEYYPRFSMYRFGFRTDKASVRAGNTGGQQLGSRDSSYMYTEDFIEEQTTVPAILSALQKAAVRKGYRYWVAIYGRTTESRVGTGWIFFDVKAQLEEIKIGQDEQIFDANRL